MFSKTNRLAKILLLSLCVLLLVPSVAYASDLQEEFTQELLEILKETNPAQYEALMAGELQDETALPPSAQLHQEQMERDSVAIAWIVIIAQSLIVTILIYSVPVAIYRYAIRKRPLSRKKAIWFTIIYAIIAFIVMSIVKEAIDGEPAKGGGLALWSWVNYMMLSRGKDEDRNKEKEPWER